MIKGSIDGPKTLRLRFELANGTFTDPDGKEGKWSLTANADGKLIFMEVEAGEVKGRVAYKARDMLIDTIEVLKGDGK